MKNALDNARDVCKYLDHDMIKEAKAHTKFFWNDLDKIRDFDATHPAPAREPVKFTVEEMQKIIDDWTKYDFVDYKQITVDVNKAIEKAHGIGSDV